MEETEVKTKFCKFWLLDSENDLKIVALNKRTPTPVNKQSKFVTITDNKLSQASQKLFLIKNPYIVKMYLLFTLNSIESNFYRKLKINNL